MKYEIEPIEVKFLGNVKYFSATFDYKLGEVPENIDVVLFNQFQAPVHTMKISLPTEVYNEWGTDDSVVVEWVAEALNVTLA